MAIRASAYWENPPVCASRLVAVVAVVAVSSDGAGEWAPVAACGQIGCNCGAFAPYFFWFFPFLVQRCQNYGNHAQFNGPFPLQVIVPRAWEQEVLLCSYVFFFSRWYLIGLAHEQHMHQSRARIGKQGEDKPSPYATTFLLLKDGLMGKGKEKRPLVIAVSNE